MAAELPAYQDEGAVNFLRLYEFVTHQMKLGTIESVDAAVRVLTPLLQGFEAVRGSSRGDGDARRTAAAARSEARVGNGVNENDPSEPRTEAYWRSQALNRLEGIHLLREYASCVARKKA